MYNFSKNSIKFMQHCNQKITGEKAQKSSANEGNFLHKFINPNTAQTNKKPKNQFRNQNKIGFSIIKINSARTMNQ